MVYHIYKHHIVLPPPPQCFGFANKQIPLFLWESRSGAWAEWAGSPRTDAFVFPFSMVTSPGTYTPGTSLLPKGQGWAQPVFRGWSSCLGLKNLAALKMSSWEVGSAERAQSDVCDLMFSITVQNNTRWNVWSDFPLILMPEYKNQHRSSLVFHLSPTPVAEFHSVLSYRLHWYLALVIGQ